MATPHNHAEKGQIAKTVLMPGDPLRAKFIADHFLENVEQFNTVRNMFGFTGTYKGKKISVMGSGMGMPSIGIYAYELYSFYGVENIIRVGTCGSFQKSAPVYSLVIAQGACTNSNWAAQYDLGEGATFSAIASYELLEKAVNEGKKKGFKINVGNILSHDNFYNASAEKTNPQWIKMGVIGVEMETYALYSTAAYLGKKALTILTVSDSLVDNVITTSEEREQKFLDMMEVALEIAE